MHTLVREFEAKQKKQDTASFRAGDTIRVHVRIIEGGKERIQDFEGVCIRRQRGGMGETFTVRRISYGIGMERVFPLHSPRVAGIDIIRRGKVRRANLAYLRDLKGKKARIAEDLLRTRKEVGAAKTAADETARRETAAAEEAARKEAEAAAQKEAAEKAAAEKATTEEAATEEAPAENAETTEDES